MKRKRYWSGGLLELLEEQLKNDSVTLKNLIESDSKKEQILTFKVEEEIYAIEILKIKELIGYQEPKPLPSSPDFVKGILNFRGEIIVVVDLRKKVLLPEKQYGKFNVIIVVEEKQKIGIIADEVEEVIPIPDSLKNEFPSYIRGIDSSFLKYIIDYQDKIIHILDCEKILTENEKKQLKEAWDAEK